MSYEVGSKVVCVDDTYDLSDPLIRRLSKPKKDVTYTIREIDSPMLLLEEIVNPEIPIDMGGFVINQEPGFHQNRFAPLHDNRDEMTDALLNSLELEHEEFEYIEVEETEEIGVV